MAGSDAGTVVMCGSGVNQRGSGGGGPTLMEGSDVDGRERHGRERR